jgi:hypothetical protein
MNTDQIEDSLRREMNYILKIVNYFWLQVKIENPATELLYTTEKLLFRLFESAFHALPMIALSNKWYIRIQHKILL